MLAKKFCSKNEIRGGTKEQIENEEKEKKNAKNTKGASNYNKQINGQPLSPFRVLFVGMI